MVRQRASTLPLNLPQLQNLIKRDPLCYHEEFLQQLRFWESKLFLFQSKPTEEDNEFVKILSFISHIVKCYPKDCVHIPDQIIELLSKHYDVLHPTVRRALVQALIQLRISDFVSQLSALSIFFQLLRCKDKDLRDMLYGYIVNDIRQANSKSRSENLNHALQNFMYSMIQDVQHTAAAYKSLQILIELYRKNVWRDVKSVNIVAEACLSSVSKIRVAGIQFFLHRFSDTDSDNESDNEHDDSRKAFTQMLVRSKLAKKTKKRETQLKRALSSMHKKENDRSRTSDVNFAAIELIHDPQEFAEKLLSQLRTTSEPFEVRLKMMHFLSRLIAIHRLLLINFYPYLMKYLQPRQSQVTLMLVMAAQSSHERLSPDMIQPLVRSILNNFVQDHCSAEAITIGLNTIREICARCPFALEDSELLAHLVSYKKYKDKGVMMAARSLIGLFRDINPSLLHKKERGLEVSKSMTDKVARFGSENVTTRVAGAELLQAYMERKDTRDKKMDPETESMNVSLNGEDSSNDDKSDVDEEIEDDTEDEEFDEEYEEFEDEEFDEDEDEDENDSEDEDEDEFSESDDSDQRSTTTTSSGPRNDSLTRHNLEEMKILTDEDFKKIRQLQMKQLVQKNEKSQIQSEGDESLDDENMSDIDEESDNEENRDYVDIGDIAKNLKRKNNYDDRVAAIRAGREGREKYGKKEKERGGTTNREKEKKKNFIMAVHKRQVKGKAKRSFREKQILKVKALLKQKKRK